MMDRLGCPSGHNKETLDLDLFFVFFLRIGSHGIHHHHLGEDFWFTIFPFASKKCKSKWNGMSGKKNYEY